MTNYDFLNISPFEFEILCRDLLQSELRISLEAFGMGADEGIDLRFSRGIDLIGQCKRYKDYNSLYQNLKKEVAKVKKLNPDKYILTTSTSLSPSQKKNILELFNPHIKSPSDIYSKEDLNNILSRNPHIEKDHYKLWLSSTNVLNTIVNSQIVNQSRFVLDEIKENIKLYVQNESFFEALNILKENNYVIISGIPGIGKTTLAQILVYDFLGNGIEEFVFLSDSINQGFQLFNEEKSQIFLFDDFLGRNFIENSLNTNEEGQIIRFINKIQKSDNKLLIFTTREYILNQAKLRFDRFDNIQFKMCIMDLSKYTTIIKAKILYNHLYFNNIPFNYIKEIIAQKYLMAIINHQNYNPRIIEFFTQSELWNSYSDKEFPAKLKEIFDYPDSIWKHAYENHITKLSRYVLCCLGLFNGKVDFENLYNQLTLFAKQIKYENNIDYLSFNKCLRELDNSFIQIKRDYLNVVNISFQNPSIQDFLIKYIDDDDNLKRDLIICSVYLKPLLSIFSNKDKTLQLKNRLSLDSALESVLFDNIIGSFDSYEYSLYNKGYSKPSKDDLAVLKLSSIVFNLDFSNESKLKEFVLEKIKNLMYSNQIGNVSVNDFYSLINKYYEELNPNFSKIMPNIIDSIWDYDDLWILKNCEENYSNDYEKFLEENDEAYNDVIYSIASDIASRDSENLQDDIDLLKELENDFYIDTYDERSQIEQKISAIEEERENDEYFHHAFEERSYSRYFTNHQSNLDDENEELRYTSVNTQEENIESMFKSLE